MFLCTREHRGLWGFMGAPEVVRKHLKIWMFQRHNTCNEDEVASLSWSVKSISTLGFFLKGVVNTIALTWCTDTGRMHVRRINLQILSEVSDQSAHLVYFSKSAINAMPFSFFALEMSFLSSPKKPWYRTQVSISSGKIDICGKQIMMQILYSSGGPINPNAPGNGHQRFAPLRQ